MTAAALLENTVQVLAIICLAGGLFFFLVGTVGLLRLPDVYSRLHATTKGDTLGAGLILLSVALQSSLAVAVKLAVIAVFIFITTPTAAHLIARVSYATGIKPWKKGEEQMEPAGRNFLE